MRIMIHKSPTAFRGRKIVEDSVEFNENVTRLLDIIESINAVWDGQDALKYINVMRDKHIVGLRHMADIIGEYGEYLAQVPEAYALLDESFASKNINV